MKTTITIVTVTSLAFVNGMLVSCAPVMKQAPPSVKPVPLVSDTIGK